MFKIKNINHKVHKVLIAIGIPQRSQRSTIQGFNFESIVPYIPTVALAKVGFVFLVVKKDFINNPNSSVRGTGGLFSKLSSFS